MTRLLVLRPEPGATATVNRARSLGIDAVAVPLFDIERIAWTPPDPSAFDGLLLTSANAVRHGAEQLRSLHGLRAYAVGEATADAARAAGFDVAATGHSGVDGLLDSIPPNLRLLHLCGEDRRAPHDARQVITPVIVYRSKEIESPDLAGSQESVALIHSPRAARRFAELVNDPRSVVIAAISQTAAGAAGTGWKSVHVASDPNDDALLALAARLCNKPDPE
jgi:uroporphyrinogen-III synthase